MSTMAGIVKRIDLDGTFLRMKIGDAIKISILEETENNLRSKVSRYNKKHWTTKQKLEDKLRRG